MKIIFIIPSQPLRLSRIVRASKATPRKPDASNAADGEHGADTKIAPEKGGGAGDP